MSSIRVIAGTLKGRRIPFDTRKYNNADITPQKVKEALFSSLGDRMRRAVFLDLYGGSGQMSVEALSRGASRVITGEPDARRFRFMKELRENLCLTERWELFHLRDSRLCTLLQEKNEKVDVIFCDPPYEKQKGPTGLYRKKLHLIEEAGILNNDGLVIMQHFTFNELEEYGGNLAPAKSHRYGNTTLTFYENVTS